MENHHNNKEEPKLAWNTPEIEILSINAKTLAGGLVVTDAGLFS